MRTRSFTLTLTITQYTLLLMHLWEVWEVFIKMKILNQVKFYTLNEKSTKVIISPKRAFCRSHHWWFPSGLNLTLCCNGNAINWRQAVTEDTRSSLTSMRALPAFFVCFSRIPQAWRSRLRSTWLWPCSTTGRRSRGWAASSCPNTWRPDPCWIPTNLELNRQGRRGTHLELNYFFKITLRLNFFFFQIYFLFALKGSYRDVGGHVPHGHACTGTCDWHIAT